MDDRLQIAAMIYARMLVAPDELFETLPQGHEAMAKECLEAADALLRADRTPPGHLASELYATPQEDDE